MRKRVVHYAYTSGYTSCRLLWCEADKQRVLHIVKDAVDDYRFVTCRRCLKLKGVRG